MTRRPTSARPTANPTGSGVASARFRNPVRRFFSSLRTQLTLALWVPAVVASLALSFVAVTTAQQSAKDREVTTVLQMADLIRNYLVAVNEESRAAFGLTGTPFQEAVDETDASLEAIYEVIDNGDVTLPPSLLTLAQRLRNEDGDQLAVLRQQITLGALPPAGVLGIYVEMRAMASMVPQDFATEVSSEAVRSQLTALAQTWMFSTRLDTEAILATLWQRQSTEPNPKFTVEPGDLAAAMRETDLASSSVVLALAKVDTPAETGIWSDDVRQGRLTFATMAGRPIQMMGQDVPLALAQPDLQGSYLTQITNRAIDTHATSDVLVDDAAELATTQDTRTTVEIWVTVSLAVLVLLVAVGTMILLTRRIVNPIVTLVAATKKQARDLPGKLDAIEHGAAVGAVDPVSVPTAGPELTEFAGGLNDLVGTAVELATKEAQQRAAVIGMLRTVAHREAALVNRQLELLDKYERHEVDPVFLSRLFNLDHVTTQMRRMCDSLLVLAGASPVRRTTPPLSLVDVVRGASSQIQQYSRVDLDVWYDPRVHGHKVSDLTLLLAELLDNATKYSHPDTRVTVTFTRGTDAAMVTIADQGIGFDDASVATAQELVDATDPDHFAMFDRLGLQTVARLCQRTGVSVLFAGGTDVAGTRVTVRIPDALLADPGSGAGMRLATAQAGETFDDSVHRPASVTLYGQQS